MEALTGTSSSAQPQLGREGDRYKERDEERERERGGEGEKEREREREREKALFCQGSPRGGGRQPQSMQV